MYRVVLVDDEHIILEGLSRVIPWEKLGCEVSGTAGNGREGLELIRAVRTDILMTDIRMPNMDGLRMIAALRSEFPRLQITVLTAFRDFEYAQTALNLGVCRYLLKPSRMDELNEAIDTMIARLDALHMPQDAAREAPEQAETAESGAAGNYIVEQALDYMRAHCAEHLSLSDVADRVYVSQWHLSKLINRHVGQSFFDILGCMRIQRAKDLLRDSSLKIYAVAEQVGYSDVAHFSMSFKRLEGMTPGEYRDSLAAAPSKNSAGGEQYEVPGYRI